MAGRVLVLVLGAVSLATALVHTDSDRRAIADRYVCPMHPEVVSSAPGSCSICGMALVHGAAPAEPENAPDRARLAPAVRRVFSEDVRAAAWVDASGGVTAMLYRDDLVGLEPDAVARFFSATAPSIGVEVKLAAGTPEAWDGSTASVRFQLAAGDAALRQGDQGSVFITARPRELLVVPTSAVVSSATGPSVLVLDPASQRFVRRPVQIGRTRPGVTAIVGGLAEGEQVAAGNAFFLDAERQSKHEGS